jgi:hypothetical protein
MHNAERPNIEKPKNSPPLSARERYLIKTLPDSKIEPIVVEPFSVALMEELTNKLDLEGTYTLICTRPNKHIHKFLITKSADGSFEIVIIDDESTEELSDEHNITTLMLKPDGQASIVKFQDTSPFTKLFDITDPEDLDLLQHGIAKNADEISYILGDTTVELDYHPLSTKVIDPTGKITTTSQASREQLRAANLSADRQKKTRLEE